MTSQREVTVTVATTNFTTPITTTVYYLVTITAKCNFKYVRSIRPPGHPLVEAAAPNLSAVNISVDEGPSSA